jgi:hypothetical protein
MASTTFTDNQTVIYASWLNDVNSVVYNGTFVASVVTPSNLVCNGTVSGTGFTSLVANVLASPPAIGNAVPAAGSFTTLSSSGLATLNSLNLTTALGAAYGGTGLTSPGTSGNVLTSNGSAWTSAAPSYFGTGQTWTDVTSSRALSTTYTNSTGKPISVMVYVVMSNGNAIYGYVNGVNIVTSSQFAGGGTFITWIVPNGATYSASGPNSSLAQWTELR